MLDTPFNFEADLCDNEFRMLGKLFLRWSHTEHVIGNCLKVMLRLSDAEAIEIVFSMSLHTRISKMRKLAPDADLSLDAQRALDEVFWVMDGIRQIRNNVVHAIVVSDGIEGQVFHLRSKARSLSKKQVFESEELTNYAAHAAYSLRYALGFKGEPGAKHDLPPRPQVPDCLKQYFK